MTAQNKNDTLNYDHESRITRLEVTIENINKSLVRIEEDTKSIKKDMATEFNSVRQEINGNFKFITNKLWHLLILNGGIFVTLLGIMAHGFKWF